MALDTTDRLALHQGLVDGLGRPTADRLMAALPPVDWSQLATKDYIDHRFELVDERFARIEERFDERFARIEDRFDERFARVDDRFEGVVHQIEARTATQIRGLFFALAGLYLANTALMAGLVGAAVAIAD